MLLDIGLAAKVKLIPVHVKYDVVLFLTLWHLHLVKIRNEAYTKAFGAHLKQLRTDKKLSRETLGAMASIESKQIYRIEEGQNPTVATVVALAVALGVHPKKLFDFDFDFSKED